MKDGFFRIQTDQIKVIKKSESKNILTMEKLKEIALTQGLIRKGKTWTKK